MSLFCFFIKKIVAKVATFELFFPSSHHIFEPFFHQAPKAIWFMLVSQAIHLNRFQFNQQWGGTNDATHWACRSWGRGGRRWNTQPKAKICLSSKKISLVSLFISRPSETARRRGSRHFESFLSLATATNTKRILGWHFFFGGLIGLESVFISSTSMWAFSSLMCQKEYFNFFFCHQAYKNPTGRGGGWWGDEEGDLRCGELKHCLTVCFCINCRCIWSVSLRHRPRHCCSSPRRRPCWDHLKLCACRACRPGLPRSVGLASAEHSYWPPRDVPWTGRAEHTAGPCRNIDSASTPRCRCSQLNCLACQCF